MDTFDFVGKGAPFSKILEKLTVGGKYKNKLVRHFVHQAMCASKITC